MKRIIPVVLLTIILLNFFGVLPVFHALQQNIRSEVKSRIKAGVPETELHVIKFSENEKINWVKEGKEFRKAGNLYDVVRSEVVNGENICYCINDVEEKMLFENLDKLCQQEQNGTPIAKTINDYFKTFSQTLPEDNPYSISTIHYSLMYFLPGTSTYLSPTILVPSPPPIQLALARL